MAYGGVSEESGCADEQSESALRRQAGAESSGGLPAVQGTPG